MAEDTPLLVVADDQGRAEAQADEAREWRGASSVRWHVLLGVFFSWAADYVILYAPSATQHTLLFVTSWTNSQFAALLSVPLVAATVAPIIGPMLIRTCGPLRIMMLGNVVSASMQLVFVFAVRDDDFRMAVVSRGVLGVFLGFHLVIVRTVAMFWFTDRDTGLAMTVSITGLSLGLLVARVVLPPMVHGGGIRSALYVAGAFPIVALIALVTAYKLRGRWLVDERVPAAIRAHSTMSLQTVAWRQFLHMDAMTYLVMVETATFSTMLILFDGGLVEPLVAEFGYSQSAANALLSIFVGAQCLLGPVVGWAMRTLGYTAQFTLASMVLMFVSALMLALHWSALASLLVFSGGAVMFPAVFAVQSVFTRRGDEAIVAAASAIAQALMRGCSVQVFGVLADSSGGWRTSLWFSVAVAGFGIMISVAVAVSDYRRGGSLHKGRLASAASAQLQAEEEDKGL